ncbi:peptide/nickel transport system substrate-binding protein [Nakamurella panacisegetis]|uniref:Peptide/nickel transport system substrate-binding protein n=1 Tax=Nakamurella panacisegetis TaxID=1090615 RepID=A0A1H0SSN5_9ACTN|nr:ABC transporter substrate-binding protein [Nakamurella panacisegetis]SDP44792.1 peptide/nickel transport system substrate-binding protein [Nakamurella panacisegetis]
MSQNISRRQLLRFGAGSAGLMIITPIIAACSTPSTPIAASSTPSTSTAGGSAGSSGASSAPGSATATATAATGGGSGTLKYARTTGPTSLDPHNTIASGDVYTLNQIFEPLYVTDVKGELKPHLATGHTVSADGKTYTFTLRKGVTFSDGSPLTAKDVVYSLLRSRDFPKSPLGFLDSAIKTVTAKDDLTVVVVLKQPWAPLISDISAFSNSIVPDKLQGKTAAAFFQAPIGTGPFTLTSWTKGGTVVLARNTRYWQSGLPYLDGVEFSIVSDDNQLVQQLQGSQVDVIDSVPPANVADIKSNSALTLINAPQWSVDLLLFNEKVAHFADRHVRRAISHLVNRKQISQAATFGTAQPADSFFPPSMQYYDGTVTVAGYDVDAAKAEIAQSKFAQGFSTEILVPSSDQAWNQTAQILQEALKAINITVKIRSIETAAYKKAFFGFDYEIAINNAINDISDPDEMASFQIDDVNGGSTSFWTGYHNPAAIKLVTQAEAELDDSKRKALYKQIQQIVADDVPYVPMTYPPVLKALRATVTGFEVNPSGAVRLENVKRS